MPKVSDEYRLARREEIIDVAIRCFVQKGFSRASIADLVAESGLSAGAIYGNFPGGKAEIFAAAATRILQSRRDELEARRQGGHLSPAEIMATLIAGIGSEQVARLLPQLWGEAAVDPEIRALVSSVFRDLRETILTVVTEWARAHPEQITGDPADWAARATPVILSAAPGYILQRALLPDFDAAGYLTALPDVLPH